MMQTEEDIRERLRKLRGEESVQDGPNLYWCRGMISALRWVLQITEQEKEVSE